MSPRWAFEVPRIAAMVLGDVRLAISLIRLAGRLVITVLGGESFLSDIFLTGDFVGDHSGEKRVIYEIDTYFYISWWVYKSTVSIVLIARCFAHLRMRHLIMTHSFAKGAVGSNTVVRATYAALLRNN